MWSTFAFFPKIKISASKPTFTVESTAWITKYLLLSPVSYLFATFGATFSPRADPIPAISSFVLITEWGPV